MRFQVSCLDLVTSDLVTNMIAVGKLGIVIFVCLYKCMINGSTARSEYTTIVVSDYFIQLNPM